MFKRITSNRDPQATIWKELSREFGHYFGRAAQSFRALCINKPGLVYGCMVALLLFSAVFSFTAGRRQDRPAASVAVARQHQPQAFKNPHPADDGFSRILSTGAALQQTLALKKQVENTLSKGRLDHADSLLLENALDSLRLLQHQIH